MKINRRRLFGAGVGAAVAGPDIAREMVAKQSYGSTAMSLPYAGMQSSINDNFIADAVARARRIASGNIIEDDFGARPDGRSHDFLDSMRSISPCGRRFIATVRYEADARDALIKRAKKALLEYDKTGMLGMLI
jgi:hypothetical protein